MRYHLLVLGLLCTSSVWTIPHYAVAQPASEIDAEERHAKELAEVHERWQQTRDGDARIALAEQALKLEASLKRWPLQESRERVKGYLWFSIAYSHRLVESAIEAYQTAALYLTREGFPDEWGLIQSNLGHIYSDRREGLLADNLEKSIAYLEGALSVRSREDSPELWANALQALGLVYRDRIRGDRADNVEKALEMLSTSLNFHTRERNSLKWAVVQNHLGILYMSRVRGDRVENLEHAIGAYKRAISAILPAGDIWSMSQANLAHAYQSRIAGDRADNLEKSIRSFNLALRHFTKRFPHEWGGIQVGLGLAHSERGSGNMPKAIAHYEAALTTLTREAFPRDHLLAARLLGSALIQTEDWQRAGAVHEMARDAFQLLFAQGLQEDDARDLIAKVGPLFSEAAFAAVQRREYEVAFSLADEGRAKLMAVALKLQTVELPLEKRQRLDALRAAIRAGERGLRGVEGSELVVAIDKLAAQRRDLLTFITSASKSVPTSELAQARKIAGKSGAIVLPIVTKFGTKVLIVTAAEDVGVIDLPELTTAKVDLVLRGDQKDGKTGGWIGAYKINYLPQPEQDERWPEWQTAIGDLGPEIWRLFGNRLDAALKERGIESGARIVWLPSGGLGILPLSLTQDPVSKRRFADDYEIVFAPNLGVLMGTTERIARTEPATLAAIINPTDDLPGTDKEGTIVASYFVRNARMLLNKGAATPEAVLSALKGKTHWHFASHGVFSWHDARESALIMHDGERLTVGRLLETDGLGRPRLVVLSACETGLFDIDRNPDEFVGLPGTFIALGAAGVLGTVWPVSDDATALLIAKFYELHMDLGLSPAAALHRAQLWLREATNDDLSTFVEVATAQDRLNSLDLGEIKRSLTTEGLKRSRNNALVDWSLSDGKPDGAERLARPYAHPYFWAGFIYTGF